MTIKVFFLAAIVLGLADSVLNQSRDVTDSAMSALLLNAREGRKAVPYRVKESTFTFQGGESKPELVATKITDYYPPDRFRIVEENKYTSGRTVRNETLWIGRIKYLRNARGAWAILAPPSMTGHVEPVVTALDVKTTAKEKHRYLGKRDLNGKPHDVYESFLSTIYQLPGKKVVYLTNRNCWFNDQGLLLRETKEEGIPGTKKRIRYLETEYDYDQKIRIEVPTK